ncbi:Small subunit (SSU) processome component [Schaereria dolodes]|nr:Small subunit (SSU) processome component [Schaereria dolodes]
MVSKKSAKRVPSKVSSATAPATASSTQTNSKSSILHYAFSPSRFQLSLFASVIQGLDAQHLRIHNTSTGKLRCEHTIDPKATITCLDWGYYALKLQDQYGEQPKKKRKRSDRANGLDGESVVVAIGTSDSEVQMLSPSEAKVLGVLKGVHSHGIRDFKFTNYGETAEAWSSGGDGKLIQWNLRKGTSIRYSECGGSDSTLPGLTSCRVLSLPNAFATTLLPLSSLLVCASQTVYMIDPVAPEHPVDFTGLTNFVHTLVPSAAKTKAPPFLLAAIESDRSLYVFETKSRKLFGSLVLESGVESLASYMEDVGDDHYQEVLAVVNKEGIVEIFFSPFDFGEDNAASLRKARTRKSIASVRVTRPDKLSTTVPVLAASFQDNFIWVAWTEGGVTLVFDKVQWRSEHTGGTMLMGRRDIVRAVSNKSNGAATLNGVKDLGKSHVDESQTVVTNGGNIGDKDRQDDRQDHSREVIAISSGEEDSSDSGSDRESKFGQNQLLPLIAHSNGAEDADVVMEDQDLKTNQDEGGDDGEPTFGDLVRANAAEPVDVAAAFGDANQHVLALSTQTDLQLPSGMSLGTVLTQSLRTNDISLLETCFHVRNLTIVRATIERLNSSLATVLLQKLAERLHGRPGRAGSLMVWIQWTLVAHGGFLASQADVVRQLTSLHQVIKERASSLQSLLSLKGKLDMLEAQMNLRKSMQKRPAAGSTDDEDEDAVIYVEGQDESTSDDENHGIGRRRSKQVHRKGGKNVPGEISDADSSDSEDEEDDMPTTAEGIASDSDEALDESDAENLLDDEASETDNDSSGEGSRDDVDHESLDSVDDDDDESEQEAPPSKRLADSKLSNGIHPEKTI